MAHERREVLRHARLLPLALLVSVSIGCNANTPAAGLNEVARVTAGATEVVLLAMTDAIKPTRNYCTLEFRSAVDGHLVDVGAVSVSTTMTMEAEPMSGFVSNVTRIGPGRYEVQMVMAMAGSWRIAVDWEGSLGKGTATFETVVQ